LLPQSPCCLTTGT